MKIRPIGKKIELEEQRKIQIEILGYVDAFCQKNGIKYFVSYGSLIGVIRHKGYIPWDDDIDICMLREDYEKFKKLFMCEKNSLYSIADRSTNSNYPFNFLKVQRNSTVVTERNTTYSFSGIYIDVFPLDPVMENPKKRIKLARKIEFYHNLVGIKIRKRMKRSSIGKTFLSDCLFILLKAIPLSWIQTNIDKNIKRGKRGSSNYVGCLSIGAYITKECIDLDCFSTQLRATFEDIDVMIPCGYDKILRQIYGDYMQLPPKEKQIYRHGIEAYWVNE